MSNPRGRAQRLFEEEQCQDRPCKEQKKNIQDWVQRNVIKTKVIECPLDRESLGRNTWSLLHTMAAFYPKEPTVQDKTNMNEFISKLSILYPCQDCAKDFRKDILESPPDLESRDRLSKWFCQMHNKVNKKIGKPEFDCSKIDERWRTGPQDGSCDL